MNWVTTAKRQEASRFEGRFGGLSIGIMSSLRLLVPVMRPLFSRRSISRAAPSALRQSVCRSRSARAYRSEHCRQCASLIRGRQHTLCGHASKVEIELLGVLGQLLDVHGPKRWLRGSGCFDSADFGFESGIRRAFLCTENGRS